MKRIFKISLFVISVIAVLASRAQTALTSQRRLVIQYLLMLSGILSLLACATTQEATWKVVPEVNMPYDRAWVIVVNTIAERFDIEVADAQSGYLRTGWKVTDTCFAGLLAGGWVPCKKTRVTVRVEKMEATTLSNYERWVLRGNDEVMEREILDDLFGRLRGQR